MEYKTELHCHTKEISPCSSESAAEVAQKYIDNGYTSLVVTNHVGNAMFDYCVKGKDWAEKVNSFFDAIELVRRAADGQLHVIDGMEVRLPESINDYLVFGMTRELLSASEGIFDLQPAEFHKFCQENGLLFIQAHPMRGGMELIPPEHVDGYEVFNGHPAQHSHNKKVQEWVSQFEGEYELIFTSGTDNHDAYMVPDAGIITEKPITSLDELMGVLRSGEYTLIKTFLGEVEE